MANLIVDPSFDTDTVGAAPNAAWSNGGMTTMTVDNAQSHSPGNSLKCVNPASGAPDIVQTVNATAGLVYQGGFWFYTASWTNAGVIGLAIQWYNGTTYLSELDINAVMTPNQWNFCGGQGKAPTSTTRVHFSPFWPTMTVVETVWVDDCFFQQSLPFGPSEARIPRGPRQAASGGMVTHPGGTF